MKKFVAAVTACIMLLTAFAAAGFFREEKVYASDVVAPKESNRYQPIPAPPAERPRVLVNQSMLPEIRERVKDEAFDEVWESLRLKADKNLDGNMPTLSESANTNIDPRTIETMKACALFYLLQEDEEMGKKAVDIAVNMASTVDWQKETDSTGIYNIGREAGNLIFIESIVYDWCYPLMSEEQKTAIKDALGVWVRNCLEYPYPMKEEDKVIIAGHANGNVHHQYKLAMGIALYDTNPEYYDDIADFLLNQTLPGFNVMLDAEMIFEGPDYGDNRLSYIMLGNQLWKAIGVEPLTSKVGLALDRQVYTRRPDGFIMPEGDNFNTSYQYPWKRFVFGNITSMLAGSVYGNPRAQYEFLRQDSVTDDLYFMLFFDPDAEVQSVYDTPLSRYFPSPYGSIVARTGWDEGKDSDAVIAIMNIGERKQTNHQHFDTGSFSLYYKGALAIDSGLYNGQNEDGSLNEYGTEHDLQYYKQSIAHNVVEIEDLTAEEQGEYSPGSQLSYSLIPKTVEQWNTDRSYQSGKVISHSIGDDEMAPDYSYIKGDIKLAYGESRVSDYNRSMVFLNFKDEEYPGALIVFDNINTPNENAKKRFLLHTINEPVVEETRYTNTVTERDYDGKLVTDTLLPKEDDLIVTKVGGEGHEFDIDGTNYPKYSTSDTNIDSLEAGKWRLELSNKAPANKTQFLNVMQVMDANDGTEPQDVNYYETDDYAGAVIADRAVFFAKDFSLTDNEATITFDGEEGKQYKALVLDLAGGYWAVTKDGEEADVKYKVEAEENTLYFLAEPGTYTLRKVDNKNFPIAESVPSEQMERKIRVRIDGVPQEYEIAPVLMSGRTMVPVSIFEGLGMTFSEDEALNTVTASKGDTTIELVLDSNIAKVNGAEEKLDAAPTKVDGEVLIPLRFVSEGVNGEVTWNEEELIVEIITAEAERELEWVKTDLPDIEPIPDEELKEISYKEFTTDSASPENVPKMFDGVLANESRWAGEIGDSIYFDFGEEIQLERVDIAIYNGHTRSSRMMFSVSDDGENWDIIYGGDTLGDTSDFLPFNLPSVKCRYFRLSVFGSTDAMVTPEWLSIQEMKFFVKK